MDERFVKLKEQLELQEWPNVYFFKFIVPNQSEMIAKIGGLFQEESEMFMQPSRNGKYTSISIKEVMMDVDSIIEKYEEAAKIKGVIAL